MLVVGDAGLGKTRLAAELADWAVVEHDAIALEGRCVPYGEANVWWPVAEALRQACFLEPTAALDEARTRTVDRVAQAFHLPHDDGEVARVSNGILHLLGYEGVAAGGRPVERPGGGGRRRSCPSSRRPPATSRSSSSCPTCTGPTPRSSS